jgi:uncharacterized protein YaaR (DUF327 family)
MKAIRKLKDCLLQKAKREKNSNGFSIENFEDVENYKVVIQELVDEISATIYGANIQKTYRISSPYYNLERFLFTKLTDDKDNISYYYVVIDTKRYKIVSVKSKWIDIQLL